MKTITADEHAHLTYHAQANGFEWYDDPENITSEMTFYRYNRGYKVVVTKYEAFEKDYFTFTLIKDCYDSPSFQSSCLSTTKNIAEMFKTVGEF